MNLHLLYDKKFAKSQISVFEKYHPGNSLYVLTRGDDLTGLDNYNVMLLSGLSRSSLVDIKKRCKGKIENVFVYNATDVHCIMAIHFKRVCRCRIYWLFFGSDLYDNLYLKFNYRLLDDDNKSVTKYVINKLKMIKHWPLFKRFAANADFFCFWNIYDYELLKKYVKTNATFKYYTHGLAFSLDDSYSNKNNDDSELIVQINHSASWDGNHLTILKKIAEIDPERKLKLLIPLSYGKKQVVKEVENYVESEKLNAEILNNFLPMENYFNLIGRVKVAIYGHHRQEGGGNIIEAFKNGTKLYLRDDNNLLRLYRDWGLKVFSFERDLNCIEDLVTPLSLDDQKHNYYRIQQCFSQDKVEESMRHFLD